MKKLVCLFLFSALYISALAQAGGVASITEAFDTYRKNALPEKMYVHTDKDFYLAGEILWFRLYAVDGFFHKPLDLSKVGYVELLDADNNAILQAKVKMDMGDGSGSLFVPVTIHSGNYKLRAYTNWMKNFGAGYFFEKQLSVINTQKIWERKPFPATTGVNIHFYPEGGNLVNGIPAKIAVGVTDQAGRGINCKGVIVNERKDTIASFQALKFGMGNFTMTPLAGQTYTAQLSLPGGNTQSSQLPLAYAYGFAMSLQDTDAKKIRITVKVSEVVNKQVFLFAHTRGVIKSALAGTLENNTIVFLVDKAGLGEGISHFTLFDSDKKPVCERLYFKYPEQKLLLDINTDAAFYEERQQVNIQLTTKQHDGNPVDAGLSMSVYRVDSLQSPADAGIGSYLLLGSDLTGPVESAGYYFSEATDETRLAMDNLMLTKGWRRFRWEEITRNTKPFFKYRPENNGHIITGKILHTITGKPGGGVQSYLSAPGINPRFRTAISDDSGRVNYEMREFFGSSAIIVQTTPQAASPYQVQIDPPFATSFTPERVAPFIMPASKPVTLLDRSIGVQVENTFTGDNRRQLNVNMVDTNRFYHQPNEMYLLDNYTRFITMEEVLREFVLAVSVRRKSGKFHLPVFNDAALFSSLFEKDPLVLLDGVPVFDMDKLMKYDPLKIRKLETVTRRYIYGKMAFDGIMNLVTYNGDLDGYELDPQATMIDYEALQLAREFYAPVYQTPAQVSSHLPDYRNVLSWQPMIQTGLKGSYQTHFYTSDLPGKYAIVVEGLSKDGKPATGVSYFDVRPAVR